MSSEHLSTPSFLQNQQRLNEFKMKWECLQEEFHQFLKEIELTPEQLNTFIENEEHFPPAIREEMEQAKKKLDEKLELELNHLSCPLEKKTSLETQAPIQKHWLFVR